MSGLTREQIEELIERSKNDRSIIVGSEVRQLANMALRSLSSPSATAATSEFVSVPREPTDDWIGFYLSQTAHRDTPSNRKLAYAELKCALLAAESAMLAAAPAPAEPVACKYPEECKHYGKCIRPDDHDHPEPCAAPTSPVVEAGAQWRDGAPPHPWDKEWFIAETTWGGQGCADGVAGRILLRLQDG